MALLANVLAVGLGSLFNEGPMIASYPQIMHPAFAPKFDNNSVSGFGRFLTSNLVISTQYQDHLYIAMANMTSGTTLPPWVSQEYFFQRYTFEESKESQPEDTYNLQTRGFGARGNCTPVPARNVPIFKDDVNQTRLDEARDESSCGSPVDWASRDMRESTTNRSTERSAIEFCGTINSSAGANPCGRSLVLGWGRTPKAEDINGTIEGSFMVCRPVFETAMFNLTVDKAGRVLSYNRVSDIESTLDYPDSENHTETLFQNVNHHWNSQTASWHNDTTTRDWMNYLMMIRLSSRSVVDPTAPLPDPKKLIGTVEDIYRRLYAIMLSLNEQLFESASDKKTVTGTRYTKETRIFMEQASFIITMTVLSLNTAAALLFYTRAVAFVLPRMPTTVGSILAYVASSRLVTPAYRVAPGQSSRTLSFGRYIGLDGNVHIGVDMDPHVTPVNPSSLRAKTGFLRRWRRKRWGQEDQSVKDGTWL
ncbi:Hypothetical protein NCS54_01153200 [Fusarium falciforme]|uniref:Hypothetical protein n=1 Tax=Fusarium falciforme TaxID=195108 RepID=UPI002301573F|nr:Hypothetical protein NCS54_01153200 [Fusarium falciforme]WAO93971.1 Hypothetical protein NCS54_01153200 [Fusarium falciforme]